MSEPVSYCSARAASQRKTRSMGMPVVQVGIMGVPVDHRRVPVRMAVRLARRDPRWMVMLMMTVMHMAMIVLHRLMRMLVSVRFGQMKP